MTVYNPFGNKTLAIYAGTVAAARYRYICVMDDDVTLPMDMEFGTFLLDGSVAAVTYPLKPVRCDDGTTDGNLFLQWQEIEYKMTDCDKVIQSRWSTVLYPHGACSLWKREILIDCLREHDTVFFGDDVRMGLWLTRHGYEMRMHVSILCLFRGLSSWVVLQR